MNLKTFKRKFEVEEICNKNFIGTRWKTYNMDQNQKHLIILVWFLLQVHSEKLIAFSMMF